MARFLCGSIRASAGAVARTWSVKTWPHSLKVLLLVMMTAEA
jgi:hypothetical protein